MMWRKRRDVRDGADLQFARCLSNLQKRQKLPLSRSSVYFVNLLGACMYAASLRFLTASSCAGCSFSKESSRGRSSAYVKVYTVPLCLNVGMYVPCFVILTDGQR